MALTSTSKQISSLKINKIPSAAIYTELVKQNKINDDELYLVEGADHIVNKFTFTATEGQTTFTIPFDFDDSSALTVYYNGVMMKETDNYIVSDNTISLVDFTAEVGDYITIMGIEGAAAVDFGEEATNAINQMNSSKTEVITAITDIKNSALAEVDAKIAELPQDTTYIMYMNRTNTMTSAGKIIMNNAYTPSGDYDLATKKYVDEHVPDMDPPVGTTTDYAIYIGSSTPASGTTPLLWIDTTSSTGVFKYRTSTTGTWKTVPVGYT